MLVWGQPPRLSSALPQRLRPKTTRVHPRRNRRNYMQKRKLGNSGLEVAPLALGGNVFGWTADEPTSLKLLDAFIDKGFNLIDTADVYSHWVPGPKGGESETIIGTWLKKRCKRSQPINANKDE